MATETLGYGDLSYDLLMVVACSSIIAAILWTFSKNSIGRVVAERTNSVLKNIRVESEHGFLFTLGGLMSVVLIAFTLYAGWQITGMALWKLFSRSGLEGAGNLFTELFQPNWAIMESVVKAMIETIFIALMATLIAIPVAFVGSFLCARNLMKGSWLGMSIYNSTRLLFNFTRSTEPIIWAIIFSVWVGIGAFAGMLALMLHSIAALAKLYSEQIESIDQGPIEALEATGAGKLEVIWYAVVPQIFLPYLSFTIYRWDINVRMATIIGLVGGGGIGSLLMLYTYQAKWAETGAIVIVISLVVWVMDYLSAKIREAVY